MQVRLRIIVLAGESEIERDFVAVAVRVFVGFQVAEVRAVPAPHHFARGVFELPRGVEVVGIYCVDHVGVVFAFELVIRVSEDRVGVGDGFSLRGGEHVGEKGLNLDSHTFRHKARMEAPPKPSH
jgi:hypothetical protein